MKKIKFHVLAYALVSVTLFASCSGGEEEEEIVIVNFEDVALDTQGVKKDSSFTTAGMNFDCLYTDYYGGFTCSSNTDKVTAGFTNQFSVYGSGGASGSKFAVFTPPYDAEAFCSFSDGAVHKVKELKITNSTYAYLAIKDGNDGFGGVKGAFTDGDYFKITITGYAGEVQTGSVDFYLADFRNGKSYICDRWTSVNIASLGEITRLGITFASTDSGEYGINTPQYVCIDDLKYVK